MQYISEYESPLGKLLLAATEKHLIGIWFENQKYFAQTLDKEVEKMDNKILKDAKKWLDIYFSGREPDFKLQICFEGSEFQKEVWNILCSIPYGCTITYGEIANFIAKQKGIKRMSAQAVGGAVGKNPISIVVPCHRVIGKNGNLTGYAGGINKKIELLKIENISREWK